MAIPLVAVNCHASVSELKLQAESLTVAGSSGDSVTVLDAPPAPNKVVIYNANTVGDYISFAVDVSDAARYAVRITFKTSTDRAKVQLAVRGAATSTYDGSFVNHGSPLDLYSSTTGFREMLVDDIAFGNAGRKQFRLSVVGKNAASTGYKIAIDSIRLSAGDSAVPVTTTATRSLRLHPFSSSAFSNTAMGSGATFASASDARTKSLLDGVPTINRLKWSISVEQATSSDPLVDVSGTRLRLPVDATTTGGTDQHMSIIQPDGVTAYEAWGMSRVSSTQWTARYLVKTDLRGDGRNDGARASGISQLHGLIRAQEVANLHIDHTLAIGIPNSKLKRVGGTGVWPAAKEDSDSASAYTGPIPMGTEFAIPPGVNIAALNLSPQGRALAVALQDYGAHVLVRSGGIALFAELSADGDGTSAMSRDWVQLRDLLRPVTNNTATNVSGGGTRRQPALPPGT